MQKYASDSGAEETVRVIQQKKFFEGIFWKMHCLKFTPSDVAFSKCVPNLRETLTYQPIHLYKDCLIIYFHL